MEHPHLYKSFVEAHAESPFWTLRGCEMPGYAIVSETILTFIQNISGTVTDPNDKFYNQPKAMFDALNLIYKILEDAKREGFVATKLDETDIDEEKFVVPKIMSVKFEVVQACISTKEETA